MDYQNVMLSDSTTEKKPDDSGDKIIPLIDFNDTEYSLILDLVQTHLDKRQGHDTVAYRQIHRKLKYNAQHNS